ncbi:PLC-like phosphodiesterase [Chaetomium tenue]|uniref:PLC-like phosphodiesterase n=1 Tax=Chaetomium tenue TaxID=1854479 RepID=A0ACB7PRP9_9PEZI|nr:PLC-like phosphodiesterase [Chaetomium globosum]
MGFALSRPAAAATLPTTLPTLTIRNLTVTPLELKLVERLESHAHLHLHKAKGLVKEPPPPSKHDITGVTISPFAECHTPVYAPDPARHEHLRLTFKDPATGHLYSAEIPASSRRSIVLKPLADDTEEEETKEFTAIYLPQHAHLALFSSANLASWMSTLDDTLPLSALSIPGTHNSPTCHVALPSVRCQAVPVLDQLHSGVRFLDVRVSCPVYTPPPPPPSSSGNDTTTTSSPNHHTPIPELSLVHSAFPISLTGPKYLSTLLSTLHSFLEAHPSETILLSLKREGTGRGSDADLAQILHTYYINNHHQNTPRWYTSPHLPTLAQARGRIVLIRRFRLPPNTPASGWGGGIDGSVWPDNVADGTCGSGTIRIQDYYGISHGGEIRQKVRFAQEGLQRAAAATAAVAAAAAVQGGVRDPGPAAPLYINFLSASNFFNASCWPDRIAVKINPSMIEYLCMGHGAPGKGPAELEIGDAATGIVVTDWVGHHGDWDLVRCIVGWNARLQLRQ